MKKFLIACLVFLSFGSEAALGCSCQIDIPKLTFVSLSEVNFSNNNEDYIEFFINKPDHIDSTLLEIEVDGKNIYDGFTLSDYNLINTDLVSTTEQIFVKYGGETIDAMCWKNSNVSKSELDDLELFESLDFGECIDSENIDNGLHLAKEELLESAWSITSNKTQGSRNSFNVTKPEAILSIQSGETIGYGELNLNFDGSSSFDENELDLKYSWDFGNGETSTKANPPAVNYDAVGSYVIELVVENSLGASSKKHAFVTVLPEESKNDSNDIETEDLEDDIDVESKIDLKIYDFMANPEGSDSGNEWIELKNSGESGFGTSWVIDDSEGQSGKFLLDEVYFEAGATIRISNETSKIGLNNTNDQVRLFKQDDLYDEVSYTVGESGVSYLEGLNVNKDTDEMIIEEAPSLDHVSYEFSEDLRISEFMPNPEGKDSGSEWVEIYNNGSDITLDGWYLMLNSKKIKLDDLNIDSNDHLVINVNSFANSGGTVGLFDPLNELIEEIEYTKSIEGNSYVRTQDGWVWTQYVTRGLKNVEVHKSIGLVENINQVGQTITISELELLYSDLPSAVIVGERVEFKYIEGELMEIELIEDQEVTLGSFKSEPKPIIDEKKQIWPYIFLYGLAMMIAVYYRKSLLEFVKTKLSEI